MYHISERERKRRQCGWVILQAGSSFCRVMFLDAFQPELADVCALVLA